MERIQRQLVWSHWPSNCRKSTTRKWTTSSIGSRTHRTWWKTKRSPELATKSRKAWSAWCRRSSLMATRTRSRSNSASIQSSHSLHAMSSSETARKAWWPLAIKKNCLTKASESTDPFLRFLPRGKRRLIWQEDQAFSRKATKSVNDWRARAPWKRSGWGIEKYKQTNCKESERSLLIKMFKLEWTQRLTHYH